MMAASASQPPSSPVRSPPPPSIAPKSPNRESILTPLPEEMGSPNRESILTPLPEEMGSPIAASCGDVPRDRRNSMLRRSSIKLVLDEINQHEYNNYECTSIIKAHARRISHGQTGNSSNHQLVDTETHNSVEYNSLDSEPQPQNQQQYYGPWAHIRSALDYTYHKHYTKKRQWLQDSIIDKLLGELVSQKQTDSYNFHDYDTRASMPPRGGLDITNIPVEPWLIFAAGDEHIHRSPLIESLLKKDRLPLLGFLLVDPIEIQRLLPEYACFFTNYDRTTAENMTRKEAGYITEVLTLAALQEGLNVLVYGIFRDKIWYEQYCKQLKNDFQHLKIAILHFVSKHEVDSSEEALKNFVDYYCKLKLLNDCNKGTDMEIATEGESWISFKANWQQTCAYVPKNIQKQRRKSFDLESKSPADGDNLRDSLLAMNKAVKSLRFTKDEMKLCYVDACQTSFRRTMSRDVDTVSMISLFKSTEENNMSHDRNFYGPFAHIRKVLDYSYHKNYKRERQVFQDAIIMDVLKMVHIVDMNGAVCTTPTEPFLLFTAGAMGAGKSYTLKQIHQKGYFPLGAFVTVDPDEIRQMFPEYSMYVEQNPLRAGEMTRKEAGYIVEILTLAAIQSGKNVLVDGTLRDSEWYKKYFEDMKAKYSNVKIAIIHVDAPRDAVIKRAQDRGIATGRVIPQETLEMALDQVPKSVNILRHHTDFYCRLMNAPDQPEIQLMTDGVSWESFSRTWLQVCAWIPKTKTMKAGFNEYTRKS